MLTKRYDSDGYELISATYIRAYIPWSRFGVLYTMEMEMLRMVSETKTVRRMARTSLD